MRSCSARAATRSAGSARAPSRGAARPLDVRQQRRQRRQRRRGWRGRPGLPLLHHARVQRHGQRAARLLRPGRGLIGQHAARRSSLGAQGAKSRLARPGLNTWAATPIRTCCNGTTDRDRGAHAAPRADRPAGAPAPVSGVSGPDLGDPQSDRLGLLAEIVPSPHRLCTNLRCPKESVTWISKRYLRSGISALGVVHVLSRAEGARLDAPRVSAEFRQWQDPGRSPRFRLDLKRNRPALGKYLLLSCLIFVASCTELRNIALG